MLKLNYDIKTPLKNAFCSLRLREPSDVGRNMTDSYADTRYGSARAWVIPHPYSSVADGTIEGEDASVEFVLDNLEIYGAGQLMLVDDNEYT